MRRDILGDENLKRMSKKTKTMSKPGNHTYEAKTISEPEKHIYKKTILFVKVLPN
jgi:hypothetical protein